MAEMFGPLNALTFVQQQGEMGRAEDRRTVSHNWRQSRTAHRWPGRTHCWVKSHP